MTSSPRVERLDAQIDALDNDWKVVAECKKDPGPGCSDAKDILAEKLEKAPKPKPIVKRAKAPSEKEQRLIAHAHLFSQMKSADPALSLPDVDAPAPDWRPDGPAQIAAYKKIWADVFEDVFFPAADAGLGGEEYAEAVARAMSPGLWTAYRDSQGSVQSLLNEIRKGSKRIPKDKAFNL